MSLPDAATSAERAGRYMEYVSQGSDFQSRPYRAGSPKFHKRQSRLESSFPDCGLFSAPDGFRYSRPSDHCLLFPLWNKIVSERTHARCTSEHATHDDLNLLVHAYSAFQRDIIPEKFPSSGVFSNFSLQNFPSSFRLFIEAE